MPKLSVLILAISTLLLSSSQSLADSKVGESTVSPLVQAARKQIGVTLSYDPSYRSIPYPNGDVPLETGVCTDVVIRALRLLGVDLQKLIHEDMRKNFSKYPKIWGLKKPDKNIDHRRVPNIRCWMKRQQWALPISNNPNDYKAGDIVTWDLSSGVPHIGIVSDKKIGQRPLIIHNIGAGAQEEDCLFEFTLTGHYRPKIIKVTYPSSPTSVQSTPKPPFAKQK